MRREPAENAIAEFMARDLSCRDVSCLWDLPELSATRVAGVNLLRLLIRNVLVRQPMNQEDGDPACRDGRLGRGARQMHAARPPGVKICGFRSAVA